MKLCIIKCPTHGLMAISIDGPDGGWQRMTPGEWISR